MTTRFAPLWFLAAGALAAVLAPHSQAADNEARAVIKALDRALLSSELAGRITSLPRRPGDAFKKGDLLVAIDCDLYNAQSAKVAAEHKGARLKVENARQLQELRSIGALEVTTAESDFAQTQAALRIAQIINDRQFEAEVVVPANWMRWVKPGTPLELKVDETGTTAKATVTAITPAIDPVSQTVVLRATLADGSQLIPGMSATAVFTPPPTH